MNLADTVVFYFDNELYGSNWFDVECLRLFGFYVDDSAIAEVSLPPLEGFTSSLIKIRVISVSS